MSVKSALKRIPAAAGLNAKYKCWRMKREYDALCRQYGTPSILESPEEIRSLAADLWRQRRAPAALSRRPGILFVGTDEQQDRSGLMQALASVSDLHVFEHAPGCHGQLWPQNAGEFDAAREHNGRVLQEAVERIDAEHGLDVVIGQMWGLSMHWKAMAAVRERGIAIVNIAMDDRHSFRGPRLSDGTWGGTAGIAPHISLSCTAAPEAVAWYRAEGHRAVFLPEASDPALFGPGEEKTVDVAFVGARYGIRDRMVGALRRADITVAAYGTGWEGGRLPTAEVAPLFARSRIILGCGTIGHCDDFVGLKLRDFDAAMSGSLYITHYNPDLEPLFELGREIVTFRDTADLVERVRHYLFADAEREAVGAAGRRRCSAEHTWEERAKLFVAPDETVTA